MIFLSIGLVDQVQQALLQGGAYRTPPPQQSFTKPRGRRKELCAVLSVIWPKACIKRTSPKRRLLSSEIFSAHNTTAVSSTILHSQRNIGKAAKHELCIYRFHRNRTKTRRKSGFSHPGSISRGGKNGVKLSDWTAENFQKSDALIFIGAVGIAVRAIAPHCKK